MDTRHGLPRLEQLFPRNGITGGTTLDIIAVHGLQTTAAKTWTAYKNGRNAEDGECHWLRDDDMLPKVLPQARIWAFDYNSNYSSNAQHVSIMDLGQVFLDMVHGKKDDQLGSRTLIFIGSCFGGIIVAQAFERASKDRSQYGYLLDSTAGIVFLGTPFRGTAAASAARWQLYIAAVMGSDASKTVLQDLEKGSSSLDNLLIDFGRMTRTDNIEVTCFYETKSTPITNAVLPAWLKGSLTKFERPKPLVPKESACLDCHARKPLNVAHTMLNKFRNPEDGSFKLISGSLKQLAEKACSRLRLTAKELECLQCLASGYREDKDRNERRAPDTCTWFLEHDRFRGWHQKDTPDLLCVFADPGCGKSVLSKALIDEHLLEKDDGGTSVCYFFFKDDDGNRRTAANAFSAILHQLFEQKPALLKYALADFQYNGAQLRNMSRTLWDILRKAAADSAAGEVVCVLDALDECEESERNTVIEVLGALYSPGEEMRTKMKFILTSRPYAHIETALGLTFQDIASITLRGDHESEKIGREIDLVIDDKIPKICRAKRLDESVQDQLARHLKMKENKTYLWLRFVFEELKRTLESTPKRLEKLVKSMPKSVSDAYEKILGRSTDPDQARRLLEIVVVAVRPMTIKEMNVAFNISERLGQGERCESSQDLDLEPEENFQNKIRSLCGLFVIIERSKIYLIHQTAKEFLLGKEPMRYASSGINFTSTCWKHSLNPTQSNVAIAHICISYLMRDEFKDVPALTGISRRDKLNQYSTVLELTHAHEFLEYAAVHWHQHAREADVKQNQHLMDSLLTIFEAESTRFTTWWTVWNVQINTFYNFETQIPLVAASVVGFEDLVRRLLAAGHDMKADTWGRTPLSYAAMSGHEAVVRLLIEQEGVEADFRDHYCRTPLSYAARHGHETVTRLLIEREDVEADSKDCSGRTPLSFAAEYGHDMVMRLLIEQDLDADTKDRHGRTPLSYAARSGHDTSVKLLIEQGRVETDTKDERGRTPLSYAAELGYEAVVRMLIEENVETDSKDCDGRTPLSYAAGCGHGTLKLLIEQEKVETDTKDERGRTPLSYAARNGHKIVAQMLIKEGVNTDSKDCDGRTPLSHAAKYGHEAVMRVLIEENVETDSKDKRGRTPLSYAAEMGYEAVVLMLIEQGVDACSKDINGFTPMIHAVDRGRKKVVELLEAVIDSDSSLD